MNMEHDRERSCVVVLVSAALLACGGLEQPADKDSQTGDAAPPAADAGPDSDNTGDGRPGDGPTPADAALDAPPAPDVTHDLAPDSKGPKCGNGAVEGQEQCDGNSLGGKTCVGAGFEGGAIACKPDCTLDTSDCVEVGPGFGITSNLKHRGEPAVAFDGQSYLVVWHDWRNGDLDIYGARVSQAGTVLDKGGIPISVGKGEQYSPDVAFDGKSFLVVWQDDRNLNGDCCHVYGARVSPGGAVLDSAGFLVAEWAKEPAVAHDGTNHLVVWQSSELWPEIHGTRVSPAGKALGTFLIADAQGYQAAPDLAFGKGQFLVVWHDSRDEGSATNVYGARVTAGGKVLDPAGIGVARAKSRQRSPAVAFDGTGFLVVWRDDRNSQGDEEIYGARVDAGGAVLDKQGIQLSPAPASLQRAPSVVFDAKSYLVVWNRYKSKAKSHDIHGTRVSTTGQVKDPGGLAISSQPGTEDHPAVAFDGSHSLVVWEDTPAQSASKTDIHGARVRTWGP